MFSSSILPEEIEKLDLAAFGGRIHIIDKKGEEFEHAIKYLRRQKIIGFDTESRPCFSPSQPHYGVSLLQLSGPREAFLFRIKLLGMDEKLCSILADEKIIKVGAAVNDDIRGLQRYRKFEARSFVDLQRIVWEYGIKDKSVKKMSAIILGFRISKTQQLSNWEAETLSESQQKYAATDAWVCREMYNKLMKSEKNPLSEEELHPVQKQEPARNADSAAKAKQSKSRGGAQKPAKSRPAIAAAENAEGASKEKRRRRRRNRNGGFHRRRYYKHKQNKDNVESNSEER